MIKAKNLIKILEKNKINFFTGVPDSILKSLSSGKLLRSKKSPQLSRVQKYAQSI